MESPRSLMVLGVSKTADFKVIPFSVNIDRVPTARQAGATCADNVKTRALDSCARRALPRDASGHSNRSSPPASWDCASDAEASESDARQRVPVSVRPS